MSTETVQRKPARKTAPKAAPKAAVEAAEIPQAPEVKRPEFKRNLKDRSKEDVIYTMNSGGIITRIANSGVFIYDEETGKNREIRYCAGEASIFVDEQNERAVRTQVIFRNNTLNVPYTKPNLREFLDRHPGNRVNGGSSFRRFEPSKQQESTVELEFLIHDAISLIKSSSMSELLPVALSLGINTDQENLAIKSALVREAKRKPAEFVDLFGNPVVQARVSIMQAFDFQIIRYRGGAVTWYDSGAVIVGVPVGQDETDVLVRFCLTDKGASVLTEIERQLSEIA